MEYTRTIERSFSVGAEPELSCANRRGRTLIRGEDRDDIQLSAKLVVDADRESEAEEYLETFDLPVEQSADRVEIGPLTMREELREELEGKLGVALRLLGSRISIENGWSTPRLELELAVPRHCRVSAENRTGPLRLEGTREGARLQGRTARMRVVDVAGDVEIETRTGNVEASSVQGNLSVQTRTGKVTASDVSGDATLRGRTGTLSVERAGGELSCSTRVGTIRVRESPGPFELSTETGKVEYVGRVASSGSIETRNGSIRLAITPDSAFFVDAHAERGRVRSELDVRDMKEPSPDAPTVHLRTHTGSIRIQRA